MDSVIYVVDSLRTARFEKSSLWRGLKLFMTSSLSSGHTSLRHRRNAERRGLYPVPSPYNLSPLHLVGPEGQLQVHTAPHRGSFSVVLSEALRAAGLGRKVMVAQFLKGGVLQGPNQAIHLCGRLEWLRPDIPCCITERATQFINEKKTPDSINPVEEVWEVCKQRILEEKLDQLVLDEVGLASALGYLRESDLVNTLERRPSSMDVILTGPSIPSQVIAMADQVTELRSGN